MTNKNCVLCKNTTAKTIKIFGRRGRESKIGDIISKHFWFTINASNEYHQEICTICWRQTKTFHQFYNNVHEAHLKISADQVETQSKNSTSFTDHHDIPAGNVNVESDEKSDTMRMKSEMMNYIAESDGRFDNNFCQVKIEAIESITDLHSEEGYDNNCGDDFNIYSNNKETNLPSEKFTNVDELLELERKIGDYFQMNCDLCSEPLQTMDDVQVHFKSKHNINRGFLKCCNKRFHVQKGILDHVRCHIDPNTFRCPACSSTFNEKRRLTDHIDRHHLNEEKLMFKCQLCEKRYSKGHLLNAHVERVHPPAGQIFSCDVCGKQYKTKKLLHNHVQSVHSEKDTKHVCDICAKLMCSKYSLKKHLKTHYECQRMECNQCGAMIKGEAGLARHIRLHKDKHKTIACDICFKVKPSRAALLSHKRNVHSARNHKCHFCEKSFTKLISLKEHTATHTGESLYSCSYCPSTFKSTSNMFKHRKQLHFTQWMAEKELVK